jgi:uncharacterized protein YdhG (YjbR/CyaY superfamily)
MDMVPEAGQGTSYGMAALSSRVVDTVRDRLTAFQPSKGTIRFTAATPLPDEVVRDIVRHRIEQIAGPTR